MLQKNYFEPKKSYIILSLIVLLISSCKELSAQDRSTNNQKRIIVADVEDSFTRGQMLPITGQAFIKETVINLEIAQTPEQQSMGLMFRDALPDDRGMLFPFAEARVARFWMNNVPVPLDMIFIKEGKVFAIANSVPPCTSKPQDCPLYGPDIPVDSVLELKAGRAKSLGLAIGDSVEIKYLKLSQSN